MKFVASLLCTALLAGGCFPHNATKRTIAQAGEGTSIVAGIVIESVINSGADCDLNNKAGVNDMTCRQDAGALGTVGLTLIVAGILGFLATTTTAEDDSDNQPVTTPGATSTGTAKTALSF